MHSVYETPGARSRPVPVSPGVSLRSAGAYSAGLSYRPLADADLNLNERDRCMMRMERRKTEVERERHFKLKKGDVGYAERRFRNEVMMELNRQQGNRAAAANAGLTPHGGGMPYPSAGQSPFGPPPPEMQNNRYQKLYENPDTAWASQEQGYYAPPAPQPSRQRRLMPFDELEKAVVKRCLRCCIESPYINNAGDFKTRIGLHRGDARRLWDILGNDTSDWSHYGTSSNMWFLINNCMNEIVNNGICAEWGRWFGNVSRRRVDDLYNKVEGSGKMLAKYNGATVELCTPGLKR